MSPLPWRPANGGVFKINSDRPIPYAVDPGFLIFKTQPPLFELSCTQTNVCMNESKRWHNLQAGLLMRAVSYYA